MQKKKSYDKVDFEKRVEKFLFIINIRSILLAFLLNYSVE